MKHSFFQWAPQYDPRFISTTTLSLIPQENLDINDFFDSATETVKITKRGFPDPNMPYFLGKRKKQEQRSENLPWTWLNLWRTLLDETDEQIPAAAESNVDSGIFSRGSSRKNFVSLCVSYSLLLTLTLRIFRSREIGMTVRRKLNEIYPDIYE